MRREATVVCLLLLGGCEKLLASSNDDYAWDALQATAAQKVEIVKLEAELARLKDQQERDRRYLEAVAASLEEARTNHANLLKTFNSNVDKSNKRDESHEEAINDVGRRLGWWR